MSEDFLEGMQIKQDERSAEVGGHSWLTNVERYGPALLFAEIAAITSRLEQMLWPMTKLGINHDRLQDLCIDMGNYADFLFQWSRMEVNRPTVTMTGQSIITGPITGPTIVSDE